MVRDRIFTTRMLVKKIGGVTKETLSIIEKNEKNIEKKDQVVIMPYIISLAGSEITNPKFNGLYFVMFFYYAAAAANKEPVLEVVSIYNDDFSTPDSREPYFIKVYRCVDDQDSVDEDCVGNVSLPNGTKPINIVVPDLNNRTKFYRYVVYNHTSCKCGNLNEDRKLYNKTVQEVNETVFWSEYECNPVNLRNKCGFCDQPRPRYRRRDDYQLLHPQSRYYLQYQCLPGCWYNSSDATVKVKLKHGRVVNRNFTNDTSCSAYAQSHEPPSPSNSTKSTAAPEGLSGDKKSSNDNESNNKLVIFIGCAKLFLAALVLSFVLLTILMLEIGFWRGKKGLFYVLCSCTGSNNDEDFSHNYHERKITEVRV